MLLVRVTCNVSDVEVTHSNTQNRSAARAIGRYTGIPRNYLPVFSLGRVFALLISVGDFPGVVYHVNSPGLRE